MDIDEFIDVGTLDPHMPLSVDELEMPIETFERKMTHPACKP